MPGRLTISPTMTFLSLSEWKVREEVDRLHLPTGIRRSQTNVSVRVVAAVATVCGHSSSWFTRAVRPAAFGCQSRLHAASQSCQISPERC